MLLGVVCGCVQLSIAFAATDAQVPFPGPQPGAAQATVDGTSASLNNDVLSLSWSIAENRPMPSSLIDKITSTRTEFAPDASEAFELTLGDNRVLKASQCRAVAAIKVLPLTVDPAAPRAADRIAGKQLAVDLASPDSELLIHWRAELRDQSHYVRQFITIETRQASVQIKNVTMSTYMMTNVAAAPIIGKTPGSPAAVGDLFIAMENPNAKITATGDGANRLLRAEVNRMTQLRPGDPLTPARALEYSAVIGVASPGQMRRAFLSYLERERAHPYRPYLHYNTWCDIHPNEKDGLERIRSFTEELVTKRGVTFNGYLFDDGWDDVTHLWQLNPKQFPNGLTTLRDEAAKGGSHLGLWLSPWGGYGGAATARVKNARANHSFSQILNGLSLSDPEYFELVRQTCRTAMQTGGVNIFKFDGVLASAVGECEAVQRLCDSLRKVDPELYCLVSTGTWASPYFLFFGDAIWRGGGDGGWLGKGSKRQQWISFRDNQSYDNVVSKSPLFPLNSLMLHGISILPLAGWSDPDPQGIRDDIRTYFSSGTSLRELYVRPSMLTSEQLDVLAEAANWARDNTAVLVDSHWIGGNPKDAVYGWASWTPRKGILVVRNPLESEQTFAVDLQDAFELPAGAAKKYSFKSPWKDQSDQPALKMQAGLQTVLKLKPFEAVILEATPVN